MPKILNDITTTLLDAFLADKRQSLGLPGLAVAIVRDSELLYAQGLGNAVAGRAMTVHTPLIIGSLSKSFTAIAVMQLVGAGKLDLDVPVQRYIPFCLADPVAAATITTRHLLTHTSGISTYAGRELLGGSGDKTIEQSVYALRTLKLTQPVGKAFQYSNTNYLIAGLIIELVAGQTYASYIQERIFTPLGMSHSYTSEREAEGLAAGYRWWFGMPLPGRVPYLHDALPAAFLISSADDMARYLIACLDADETLLSPTGFAELFRPQVPTANAGSSYTLGWRRSQLDGMPVIFHTGEVANFRCEMLLLPEQRTGIVVLANCNNGLIADLSLDRIVPGIVSILQGRQAETRKLTLRRLYLILNITLGFLTVLQAAWTWRVVRAKKHASTGSLLGMLADIVVPIAAIKVLPRVFDAPWSLLRFYVPDITVWLYCVIVPFSFLRLIFRRAMLLVRRH